MTIPTDVSAADRLTDDMALKKRWRQMPLPALVDALDQQTGDMNAAL